MVSKAVVAVASVGLVSPGVVAAATDWAQLGATFTLVVPLYVAMFLVMRRLGILSQTPDNVGDNSEDIEELRNELRAHGRMLDQNRRIMQEHRRSLEELHDDHLSFSEELEDRKGE